MDIVKKNIPVNLNVVYLHFDVSDAQQLQTVFPELWLPMPDWPGFEIRMHIKE